MIRIDTDKNWNSLNPKLADKKKQKIWIRIDTDKNNLSSFQYSTQNTLAKQKVIYQKNIKNLKKIRNI